MNKTLLHTKEGQMLQKLNADGYEAYLVGGFVRDNLLHLESNDMDIVTNASPDEVAESLGSFGYANFVGKTFGVVIIDGVEIAQYRSEEYEVNGKPSVTAVSSVKQDALRRDFTVNALYMDIHGHIHDFVHGLADIEAKVINTVGEPAERFKEDASRILRAPYLAAKLGFEIAPHVKEAMYEQRDLLRLVPQELIGKIILKSIKTGTFSTFVRLIHQCGLLKMIFPEMAHLDGLPQNPKYHKLDALTHTLKVLESAESLAPKNTSVILGALFHDVAKGMEGVRGINSEGQPNDLGHEAAGAPIAGNKIKMLGLGSQIAHEVSFIVEYHGLRMTPKPTKYARMLHKLAPKCMNIDDLKKKFDYTLLVMEADSNGEFSDELTIEMKEMVNYLKNEKETVFKDNIFFIHQLPINGRDVMEHSDLRDARIGEFLKELVRLNIHDKEHALRILNRQ